MAAQSSLNAMHAPAKAKGRPPVSRGFSGMLANISISRQFAFLCFLSIAMVLGCLAYTLFDIRGQMMTQDRKSVV